MTAPQPIAEIVVQQSGDVLTLWPASPDAAAWLDATAPQYAASYDSWSGGKARRLIVLPLYRPDDVAEWLRAYVEA